MWIRALEGHKTEIGTRTGFLRVVEPELEPELVFLTKTIRIIYDSPRKL